MNLIKRIVLRSTSGYGTLESAYHDELVIERNCISYKYEPFEETLSNPKQKWQYKAISPLFEQTFDDISMIMHGIMKFNPGEIIYDMGGTYIQITFSDKTKWEQSFYRYNDMFGFLFLSIKKLIPSCEKTPFILKTSDEYMD
jgi:hypothetical protein